MKGGIRQNKARVRLFDSVHVTSAGTRAEMRKAAQGTFHGAAAPAGMGESGRSVCLGPAGGRLCAWFPQEAGADGEFQPSSSADREERPIAAGQNQQVTTWWRVFLP